MTQEYKIVSGCIPTIQVDDKGEEINGDGSPQVYAGSDGYFEKRIGRIKGGPPPRGKPKPPVPWAAPAPAGNSQATEAIHRAISIRRK